MEEMGTDLYKGEVQSCSNYREIKLMSHIRIWEILAETRLREGVMI